MQPKVSILMNCFNGERYLKESLLSILNQTYKNWELIFWDNQSKDNSKKIFKSFKDTRFKYYFANKFTNLYVARNLAIKKILGEIITFIDVDDIWYPDKLEKQVNFFKQNKEVKIIYSNYSILKNFFCFSFKKIKFKKKLPSGYITEQLLNYYTIGLLTVAIKRDAINLKKKIFNERLNMIADFEFILKLSENNKIFCIQEPLAVYRYHSNQLSRKNFFLQIAQLIKWYNLKKTIKMYKKFNRSNEINSKIFFLKSICSIKKGNYPIKKIFHTFINGEIKLALKLVFFILFPNLYIAYIMSN